MNRELIDRYVVEVSAYQQNESAQTTLQVEVTDVNDNSPTLVGPPGTVISVPSHAALHTLVTRVNATDSDAGENSRLNYHIINHNIPFEINRTTGVIRTKGVLDADGILPMYDIMVYVRDAGRPRLEAYITYTINILTSGSVSEPTATEPQTTPSMATPVVKERVTSAKCPVTMTSTETSTGATTLSTFVLVLVGVGLFFLVVLVIITIGVIKVCRVWMRKRQEHKKRYVANIIPDDLAPL